MAFNATAVFVRVVQAGGFSAAARQLALPTSTVSARVARLEKRLGVTLLQRTTRRLSLTEAGELYYRHAATGLGHLLEAEAAVSAASGEPRGLLRVTAPPDLGDVVLSGLLIELRRAYPGIDVELILSDRTLDLVAEGLDAAIRAGELRDSTLVARRVGIACWAPYASPGYLRRMPAPARPEQLSQHDCLQFTPLGREHWILSDTRSSVTIPLDARIVVNDFGVVKSLALAGAGVALLPTYMCREETASGKLTRLLPEWRAKADPVQLVYPRQKFVPPKLRVFVDLAAEVLKRWLD